MLKETQFKNCGILNKENRVNNFSLASQLELKSLQLKSSLNKLRQVKLSSKLVQLKVIFLSIVILNKHLPAVCFLPNLLHHLLPSLSNHLLPESLLQRAHFQFYNISEHPLSHISYTILFLCVHSDSICR